MARRWRPWAVIALLRVVFGFGMRQLVNCVSRFERFTSKHRLRFLRTGKCSCWAPVGGSSKSLQGETCFHWRERTSVTVTLPLFLRTAGLSPYLVIPKGLNYRSGILINPGNLGGR